MWVGGCECWRVGLVVVVGGSLVFIKGMEPSGCRQTDWGNTWHNSQINKRESKREREGGRGRESLTVGDRGQGHFPDNSLWGDKGNMAFYICSQSRLATGSRQNSPEKSAQSEEKVDRNFTVHNNVLAAWDSNAELHDFLERRCRSVRLSMIGMSRTRAAAARPTVWWGADEETAARHVDPRRECGGALPVCACLCLHSWACRCLD